MKYRLFYLFLFLGFLSQSNAQQQVFANRTFNEMRVSEENLNVITSLHAFQGRAYAYFRWRQIPDAKELENAAAAGVRLLEFIPGNIYLMSFPANAQGIGYIKNNLLIESRITFDQEKFSLNFIRQYAGALASSNKVQLYVYSFDDISIDAFADAVKSYATVLSSSALFHRLIIEIPLNQIEALRFCGAVKTIDVTPLKPVIDNLPGKTNHRSSVLGSGFGRNLQGDSIIIGEWDGAGVGTHVDIDSPRVTRFHPYTNNTNGQHATHVAGTMAGAGIIDPYATGMAPNAKVYSWNFNGDITGQMDSGVRFQNIIMTQNSYGYSDAEDTCKNRGQYDDISHELDVLVRNYPHLIHVFAAGNSQALCGLGGYRTVFSGFQSAKNLITVGALTSQDAMSSFSSWGPVRDGRLKPEVCAVGVNVYSTQNNNLYGGGWNGTSMACPGASGTMAQLVQRYHQLHGGADPLASLMRAIFANTADDVMNAGPDFKSGFGRINGLTAVKAIEENRYVVDSVSNTGVKMDSIFVSLGTNQLKVTLAWSDKEASAMASKSLVNDLDLYIITPINDTLKPWVLDTMNRNSLAVRGMDSVNNIEQITLDNPAQGYYKIYISGRSVPFGPQVYAYAYERVAKAITVVYPNGGELFRPSTSEVIKWDANGVGSTCNIEYSFNNGGSWTTMVSGISTALKNYTWGVPNTNTSTARIRITAGAYSDVSDTAFSILPVVDSIKGVVCDKQVTLKWKKIAGVTGYDVMQLINGSMQSVAITVDTFYTVTNLTNGVKYWFTVRGKYNNVYGQRAYGVSFTPTNATAPPFITLQPSFTPVCSGSLVVLKTLGIGAAPVLRQWQLSIDSGKTFSNITGATDSILSFIAFTGMNNLRVRAFYYNSCQNFQYTDTIKIVVDTAIFFTSQPQNMTICDGGNAYFQALAPSNSGTTYQWQVNDGVSGWTDITGATDTILQINNAGYAMNGYRYRLLASNQCSNRIPSNDAVLVVKAPLSVTANGTNTICKGATAYLSALATGGDTARYVFEWSLNGTVIQRLHTPALQVLPTTPQTYKVVLIDSCSQYSDSDSVTVNVLPPLTITANNAVMICKGNSVNLSAAASGGNGNYTYGWLRGTTLLQYSKLTTLPVAPAVTTTYKVYVTDSCTMLNDTATIEVTVREALSVTWRTIPDTVCIGATSSIIATGNGGDSTYTYTFIDANTNTVLQSGPINFYATVINPNNNYIIILNDSCTTKNDSVRFRVPMRSKLSLNMSKNPSTTVCSGSPVTLTANPSGGALKNYTYQWRESGSTTILGTSKQLTVSPSVSTRYVVTLNDGCTILNAKDSIMVLIETPDPLFTSSYSIGQDYAFFVPAHSGYKSYLWNFGDGETTSEFQPNHRYKTKGDYYVCLSVTTFSDCDSQFCDTVHVFFNNGINSNTVQHRFNLSPNPFTDIIRLTFDDQVPHSIELFDATGRSMMVQMETFSNTLIQTKELASGTYYLMLYFEDGVNYVKLIKN